MKTIGKRCIYNTNVLIKKKKSMISLIINKNVLYNNENSKNASNTTSTKINNSTITYSPTKNENRDNAMIIDKENKFRRSPSPQKCNYFLF